MHAAKVVRVYIYINPASEKLSTQSIKLIGARFWKNNIITISATHSSKNYIFISFLIPRNIIIKLCVCGLREK